MPLHWRQAFPQNPKAGWISIRNFQPQIRNKPRRLSFQQSRWVGQRSGAESAPTERLDFGRRRHRRLVARRSRLSAHPVRLMGRSLTWFEHMLRRSAWTGTPAVSSYSFCFSSPGSEERSPPYFSYKNGTGLPRICSTFISPIPASHSAIFFITHGGLKMPRGGKI